MSYKEERVRVKNFGRAPNFGSLPGDSRLLVEVPGVAGKPRHLHKLAAAALERMAAAVLEDVKVEILVASGWRPHRWKSRQQYQQVLVQRFGSVARGKRLLAYWSPHETGLAMDIGSGGLTPSIRSKDKQLKTPLHQWLVENAWKYGWHPYKVEPWHWEFPLSNPAWETGTPDAPGSAEAGGTAAEVQAAADGSDDDEDVVEDEDAVEGHDAAGN